MASNRSNLTRKASLVALAIVASAAHAVDLRSWDSQIDSGAERFVIPESLNGEAVLDRETQLV